MMGKVLQLEVPSVMSKTCKVGSWDRVEKCWIMQRPLEQTDSSAPQYSEEEPEIYVQT